MRTSTARWFGTAAGTSLVLYLLISLSSITPASAETLGSWTTTNPWENSYETGITDQSCAAYNGYIYCVGGFLVGGPRDEAYYAPISSSGVGTWTQTTTYPTGFSGGSCAISNGYIYCVGGDATVNPPGFTADVYYASVSSSGIGTWTSTTAYPVIIADESCAISGSDIFCVGGTSDFSYPNTPGNVVEYAPISSSGVGAWQTSDFPIVISGASCSISSGYIYCVGGDVIPSHEVIPVPSNLVYYASVSSDGVGTWTESTIYPINVTYSSCGTANGYVYCVGGQTDNDGDFTDATYYASVSSDGVGAWSSTSNYPQTIYAESCVTYSGYIYCVGGQTTGSFIVGSVNYASISGSSSTTSSSSSTTSSASSTSVSTSSTSSTTSTVPVCPSTSGGSLMPLGATFTDQNGNTWTAPGGSVGGLTFSSYFFPGPESNIPPPLQQGWGGVYGTYNGQQGWIITFFC